MPPWKHRLTAADLDALTGICANCGPVRLAKRSRGPGRAPSYMCGPAREQYRHSANRRSRVQPHGLTLEEARDWLAGKVCAICGRGPDDGVRMAVDHCHETGRRRDALCLPCNGAIGFFQDDPGRMEAAAAYVRRHSKAPAV